MKNKLHKSNTLCHAELLTERSRSAASHYASNRFISNTDSYRKVKSPNFQILLFSILYSLLSIPATAQTYNWQWAMKGGGSNGGIDEEQIHDIKVGTDNNYYFIATIEGNSNTQLDGEPVDVYNSTIGGKDIFLFSTDCEGQVRWSQAIGGEDNDRAYNLVLDSNNNVYVGAYVTGGSSYNLHFSPDTAHDITPFPANMDAHKRIYLVKYNSNGIFQGKKAVQGTVSGALDAEARIFDLVIDSQNKLHFIVGLLSGTHLDSQVTVPSQYVYDPSTWTFNFQYRLVQYDTDLDYVNSMVLPIDPTSIFPIGKNRFAFDETLNRYYIAGERELGFDLIYDGDAIVNKAFILVFDGSNGNEIWRREVYADPTGAGGLADNRFNSLIIDGNSDVYFGGRVYQSANAQNPIKIYDPTNTNVQPYLFTPTTNYALPMIMKLNSDGDVQWVQATAAHDSFISASAPRRGKGITINGSEVAFGVQGGADTWGTINIVRPLGASFQPDPVLVRLNKQTGAVINVHDIQGEAVSTKQMTAVATDNDGNYITAGTFNANLFMNNTLGITPLVSTGQSDFFVAKLGAYACGTNSTEKFNNIKVNVYPNPTNDIINIETDETLLNYVVYDMNGREIQKGLFNGTNQISLHGAASGSYFIKVTTTQGSTATVQVVKK